MKEGEAKKKSELLRKKVSTPKPLVFAICSLIGLYCSFFKQKQQQQCPGLRLMCQLHMNGAHYKYTFKVFSCIPQLTNSQLHLSVLPILHLWSSL